MLHDTSNMANVTLNEDALAVLLKAAATDPLREFRFARRPGIWARRVARKYSGEIAEDRGPMSRADLRTFTMAQPDLSDDSILAICAWGGMRVSHGAAFWQTHSTWMPVLKSALAAGTTRQEAYRQLSVARRSGQLPGMGVAYFTKLIHFLRPKLGAYILDQWLGRSVNVLFSSEVIKLTHGATVVSDQNSPEVYERYCSMIEGLAEKIPLAPDVLEATLFSYGGKQKGVWRHYVVTNG